MPAHNQESCLSLLLIACTALILSGITAVSAGAAWRPAVAGGRGIVYAQERFPEPLLPPDTAEERIPRLPEDEMRHTGMKCRECGVVESARTLGLIGQESIPGTIALRLPGNQEITVRMQDGSSRVFVEAAIVHRQSGERVILIGGPDAIGD